MSPPGSNCKAVPNSKRETPCRPPTSLTHREPAGRHAQGPLFADLDKLEEQLRAGEVDFLRVFTARTSLLQLRRAHLDALNELAQAAANLTGVTGIPPNALLAGRASGATPGP